MAIHDYAATKSGAVNNFALFGGYLRGLSQPGSNLPTGCEHIRSMGKARCRRMLISLSSKLCYFDSVTSTRIRHPTFTGSQMINTRKGLWLEWLLVVILFLASNLNSALRQKQNTLNGGTAWETPYYKLA